MQNSNELLNRGASPFLSRPGGIVQCQLLQEEVGQKKKQEGFFARFLDSMDHSSDLQNVDLNELVRRDRKQAIKSVSQLDLVVEQVRDHSEHGADSDLDSSNHSASERESFISEFLCQVDERHDEEFVRVNLMI